jgi:hypothetical protein
MMQRLRLLRQGAEALVMLALLWGIDQFVLHGNAFEGTDPNPYWWPILIMALAYGTGMGLLTAGLASVLWLIAPHAAPHGADKLQSILGVSLYPLMWTVAAVLVGEVTAARRSALADGQQRTSELELEQATITQILEQLADANRQLQVRIATNERSVGEAVEIATGLMEADPQLRHEAVKRLIALACQTDDFTYLEARGAQMVPRLRGDAASPLLTEFPRNGAPPASEALSVPVYQGLGEELAGMLLIHNVAPSLKTDAKRAELALVAQSVSALLAGGRHAGLNDPGWRMIEDKVA